MKAQSALMRDPCLDSDFIEIHYDITYLRLKGSLTLLELGEFGLERTHLVEPDS